MEDQQPRDTVPEETYRTRELAGKPSRSVLGFGMEGTWMKSAVVRSFERVEKRAKTRWVRIARLPACEL